MKKNVDEIITATDDQIFTSMKLVADRLKLVSEPTVVFSALPESRPLSTKARSPVAPVSQP